MSDTAAQVPQGPPSTAKRDHLLSVQRDMQQRWAAERLFEQDAPESSAASKYTGKWMGTFPYPYMNGRLHLGHVFTLSRVEFAAGYERMNGKHVLFPFGLHCTGQPIKACADKLAKEIDLYGGRPPTPPPAAAAGDAAESQDGDAAPEQAGAAGAPAGAEASGGASGAAAAAASAVPGQHRSKKSKATAKAGSVYQWNILASMGVPADEIPRFRDSNYWLTYFPPLAVEDLTYMGAKVDWRRSFITTDVNPYYDSFVRWQFNKLRALGKVKLGERHTIWSPLDDEPCLDHDRASGEGVLPQEYTCIKMRLLEPYPAVLEPLKQAGGDVFFVAATLRPETMYGQTNFFVLPEGEYGAFRMGDGTVLLCCERAAQNMAYQKLTAKRGVVDKLLTFKGADVIGCSVRAPLTKYERVHCLPMFGILMTKGTGVVTSVPSDSPDDFATYTDIRKKQALRERFSITDAMLPEPVPIIETPGWGNMAGQTACEKFKVTSQNDREKLRQAKEAVYKAGFYDGVLTVGPYAGRAVREVKPIVRDELIAAGDAFAYAEPENEVISRSGSECVVALCEQWYITYGESEWQAATRDCLAAMECYHDETRAQFEHTLGWLRDWACARAFGLGSRLPFDPHFLVESLSDSTIYMAYYTVAHLLQSKLDGSAQGSAHVAASAMTDAVWDFVLQDAPYPADCGIPQATLEHMRREFLYWYPVDLRVSGKDLLQNHLTMFLYNHVAIFPKHQWPRGVRCNGHVLLNSKKMAKSTGNFLTLRDGVDKFTADGMRMALAVAGDSMDDANFDEVVADNCLLRLHQLLTWTQEVQSGAVQLRSGDKDLLWDRVFESDMNRLLGLATESYRKMLYSAAMTVGFFELQTARDVYRRACGSKGMHADLVRQFIDVQVKLLAPVASHTCDYIWRDVLGNKGSVFDSRFPAASPLGVDTGALRLRDHLSELSHTMNKRLVLAGKGRVSENDVYDIYIYVADKHPAWKETALRVLGEMYAADASSLSDDKAVATSVAAKLKAAGVPPKDAGQFMPFFKAVVKPQLATHGAAALSPSLPFNELVVVRENIDFVQNSISWSATVHVHVVGAEDADPANSKKRAMAVPGEPAVDVVVTPGSNAAGASS